MFITYLLYLLLGIFFGCITGLIPGIHINLVCSILLFFNLNHYFAITIISMSITHTFLDTIPSAFLGIPSDVILNALPLHRETLNGNAFKGIYYTLIGSLFTTICSFCLIPISYLLLKHTYDYIKLSFPYVLFIIMIYLFFKNKPLKSKITFIFAFLIGYISLIQLSLKNPLFHLLSGFFALACLDFKKSTIPKQIIEYPPIKLKYFVVSLFSSFGGFLTSIAPGIGSAFAILIISIFKKFKEESFLVLTGGINTANFYFSLIMFYLFDKSRNGSISAISNFITPNFESFLLFILLSLLSGIIAFKIGIFFAKKFTLIIPKLNIKIINFILISIIIFISFCFDGIIGLLILLSSTLVGIYSLKNNVSRKINLVSLIGPTLINLI